MTTDLEEQQAESDVRFDALKPPEVRWVVGQPGTQHPPLDLEAFVRSIAREELDARSARKPPVA